MVLGASFTSLAVAAGGLLFFGAAVPPFLSDTLVLLGVASAFVAICSAEAHFAS